MRTFDDREKARAAGRKGGKSVRPENRSFSKNPELARAAGRKGGLSVSSENRTFSRDRAAASRASKARRIPKEADVTLQPVAPDEDLGGEPLDENGAARS